MPLRLFRALTARTLECTRCGSPDVHPSPGSMGPLIAILGFMRYGCRGCRRNFWIRADAGSRRTKATPAPSGSPAPTKATETRTAAPTAKLDFEVTPARHEKVDLTPLDAEFEKIRRGED